MSCAIAVMAKAPQPGRSKTRLVPPLSPEEAAGLSAAFLRDITENLRLVGEEVPIAPFVAYAPAGREALFDGILAPGTRLILADGTPEMPAGVTGFGRCLLHAVQTLSNAGYSAACVLNSDSPTLPTRYLKRAVEVLDMPGDRVVLGPAEDGGYYLLGVKRPHAQLFADIDWSTDRVAAQTRERAAALGIPLVELGPWYDVDDSDSLARLLDDLGMTPPPGFSAPNTATYIAELGLHILSAA
jgi:rSAM/selenodomain-associated transferase 1